MIAMKKRALPGVVDSKSGAVTFESSYIEEAREFLRRAGLVCIPQIARWRSEDGRLTGAISYGGGTWHAAYITVNTQKENTA